MARPAKPNESLLGQELELKQYQLASLLEITQAINQNFSAEQLYNIYKFVLRTQLKIKKLAVLVADVGWTVPILYGVDLNTDVMDVVKELLKYTEACETNETFPPFCQGFQVLIPVLHKSKPLAYVLLGDTQIGKLELKSDLVPFIQTVTNIIIVAIENKKFAREQIRQQGIKIELALAAQMQAMLIPETLPIDADIEMHARYLPHQELGGDYYDCIELNEQEVIFCMADVSGKGIPAALLMANFQANLHALVRITHNLKILINDLNQRVMEAARSEKFITLFLAKYNRNTHRLTYINAGHNPPLLANNGDVLQLREGTTGLGMIDELVFVNEGSVEIKKDSLFLSYTDGAVETEDEAGNEYGIERLSAFLQEYGRKLNPADFNNALIGNITAFKGKNTFSDDVTLLLCKFN